MNQLPEGPLRPMVALLGYQCPPLSFEAGFDGRSADRPGGAIVLMTHEVVPAKGGYRLGSGTPLSRDDIEGLVRLLEGRAPSGRLLPATLLLKERGRAAWFQPAAKRRMYFRPRAGKPFHVTVWWPSLVFEASGERLRAAAYAGCGRPAEATALYVPPLMNVSDDGSVCRGSASERIGHDADDLAKWEAVMFDTNFSHVNSPRTLRSRKEVRDTDHLRYWRAKARSGARVRANELSPMGKTLAQWLAVRAGRAE